ncbi:rCG52625 [Rattus norvegicus]|uniref:RCG52625 n=1 Tax=Rattus norvegicus TaxID=10116 RepID=A6IR83_RAT|nr:rCG52625 [Rattus norvegicus]
MGRRGFFCIAQAVLKLPHVDQAALGLISNSEFHLLLPKCWD